MWVLDWVAAEADKEDVPEDLKQSVGTERQIGFRITYEDDWCDNQNNEAYNDNFEDHQVHDAENAKYQPPEVG